MGPVKRPPLWLLCLTACGAPTLDQSSGTDVADESTLTGPSQTPAEAAATTICINELMPVNDFSLVLDDGNSPDWVELHNPSDYLVSLDGWQLHNEATGVSGALDGLSIEAGAWLLLYADEGEQGGALSLPFKLSSDGGSLWLESPDGGGERLTFGWSDDDHAIAKQTDCCDIADCLEHRYRGSPGESNSE